MSEQVDPEVPDERTTGSNRTRLITAGVVGAVLLIVVIVVVTSIAGGGGNPSADPDPSRSSGPSSSASVSPSEAVTPTPTSTEPASPVPVEEDPATDVPGGTVVDVVGDGDTANFGDRVRTRLVAVEAFTAEGNVAGEISGPALRFEIQLQNETDAPIELGTATVTLDYSPERTPAPPVESLTRQFSGVVEAGGSRNATYVFSIPEAEQGEFVLSFSYAAERPYVVFRR